MTLYYCATSGDVVDAERAGSCCDRPDLHRPICAHCLGLLRGYGRASDGSLLCHPDRPLGAQDSGLDCYVEVTVNGHAMPCGECTRTRVVDPAVGSGS